MTGKKTSTTPAIVASAPSVGTPQAAAVAPVAAAPPTPKAAAPVAPKAAAPAKPPAPPKEKMPNAYGVTRPSPNTDTGKVWALVDENLASDGTIPKRADIIAKGTTLGLNPSTIATQYGRYRKYHGLGPEPKAAPVIDPAKTPVAENPAAAPPAAEIIAADNDADQGVGVDVTDYAAEAEGAVETVE